MNIAFFTAHPDDHEMMLAYQTLELQSRPDTTLYAYIATNGEASTLGHPAFVRSGQRRHESAAGLAALGIRSGHIHHAGLPDGRLTDEATFTQLGGSIRHFIEHHQITQAVTLGANGGDYHPDHIAVHQAVAGQKLPILALNAAHTGQLAITPTISQRLAKLTALSHHRSQFPEPSRIGPPWERFLAAETYDHILNAL